MTTPDPIEPPAWLSDMAAGSGLFDAPIPAADAVRSVRSDRFDEATWLETRRNVESVDFLAREFGKEHDYVDDFFADFFHLTHKGDPQLRTRAEVARTRQPNHAMIEQFRAYPEHEQLRQYTAGDNYHAAMAMLSMQTELEEAYAKMAAAQALAEQAKGIGDQLIAEQDAAREALEAALADPDSADGQALAAMLEQLQQQADAAQQAADAADAAADGANAAPGLRGAAKRAAEERAEEDKLGTAFGVDPGELQRMSFDERHALAKRLRSSRLAQFAPLIGQFRTFAAAERRRKVKHVPDEVVGVKLGDDLLALTSSEMMNMATPEMDDDFWLRFSEHRLAVNEMSGTERVGQGPIIVVCDESMSMGADDMSGATREAWSKAFSLALLDQARAQHRDFTYIGFSSVGQQWTTHFPAGRGPISQVIEFTEHFYAGGTHYETPLAMALDLIDAAARADLPKADVVFITDDEYAAPAPAFYERWTAAKARHGMTCYGVGIGVQPHRSGAMHLLSDNVREITRLANDVSLVADIFRTL